MSSRKYQVLLGHLPRCKGAEAVLRRAQVQRVQKFVGNRQLPQGLRDDVMRHMEATRSVTSDPDAGEIFPRLSHILQACTLPRPRQHTLPRLSHILQACTLPCLRQHSVIADLQVKQGF